MATKNPLPKKHEATEKHIFELVSTKGVSKTHCIRQLRLPPNYFNQWHGTSDNFDCAMSTFVAEVLMKSVTENLNFDSANRKYLLEKLRVMDSPIDLPIKKMTTAKHAAKNLSHALNEYAQKNISDTTLLNVKQSCEVFSKLMVATDIETRLQAIEKMFESSGK